MVGRPGKFQPRFTAGELDALIQANTDEKIYYTGASRFANVRPIPQGGFANCLGLRSVGRVRNLLATLATTAALSVANVAAGQVVLQQALPAAGPIAVVDVQAFALSAGSGTLRVDTSADGVTWQPIGSTVNLLTTSRGRRFAAAPGAAATAAAYRVVVASVSTAGATLTLAGTVAWSETAALSVCRLKPFTYSRTQAYDLVFTDGNVDIYNAGGYCASAATPWSAAQLAAVKSVQQLDTYIGFHQNVAPTRLMRQGGDAEWNVDLVPWTGIPSFNFGDVTYTNGVAAQWSLQFFNAATANHFTITVNGATTPALAYSSLSAAQIQAAIAALPGISAGVTVDTSNNYLITFGGANVANGDGFAVSASIVDNASAAVIAAHVTVGVPGGEPLMSTTRGWPACGAFFGGRLVMGGFLGVPNVVLASQAGAYFQLDTRLTAATAPMLIPIDTEGAATVLSLHKGRTLLIFCDSGEYWLNGTGLDRTQVPNIGLATNNGIAPTTAPLESEGATIFVSALGGTLFEFKFDYAVQNYSASNISVVSSALVKGVVDADIRRLTGSTDVNELYCVRSDGLAFMVNLLREQEITSFARRLTDGNFLAVAVNGRFQVGFLVSRLVGGARVQFFERLEENLLLDGAVDVTLPAKGTLVAGLGIHEGATVWAVADGYVQGPFNVTGGAITLNFAATNVTVGRWIAPDVRTLPQPNDIAPHTVSRRPSRVHTVRASVVGTSSIAVGANGGAASDVGLARFGGATDTPLLLTPYTGPIAVEGIPGYSEDAIVEITQTQPGTLTVTGVTVEVDQ